MELPANGAATMRRGSYDDAALCLRPVSICLAQRDGDKNGVMLYMDCISLLTQGIYRVLVTLDI